MMSEPDFSGIDPLRVPEARRRVATIEKFLELPAPTAADSQRFANSIVSAAFSYGVSHGSCGTTATPGCSLSASAAPQRANTTSTNAPSQSRTR